MGSLNEAYSTKLFSFFTTFNLSTKIMKQLLFVLATALFAFTFSTTDALAQKTKAKPATEAGAKDKKTPESVAQKATDRLVKALGLNADQKTKTYTACLKAATQIKDIRTKFKGDKTKTHAEAKKVKESLNAEMKTFLTADQYKKMLELAKKKHKGDKGKSGKGKANSKGKAGGEDNEEDDLF